MGDAVFLDWEILPSFIGADLIWLHLVYVGSHVGHYKKPTLS